MTTVWEAIYTDETKLKEIDGEKENLFRDIQQNKLREFAVYHNNRVISLFPDSGVFGINGLLYKTDLSEKDFEYRLIFFARRQKRLGTAGASPGINTYFVGFQTLVDGVNKKRLISMCDNEIKFIEE